MKKLYVYADFDWLVQPKLVGELTYDSLRGNDSYGFKFDEDWLRNFGFLFLSADLNNYPGMQYTQPGRDLFGCFSDALPDRWGRTLLNRREQLSAMDENRPARRLGSFDYLTGIDDFSRMGGFRFKENPANDYICTEQVLPIPPLANIRDMLIASREIEKSEKRNLLPSKKWIQQLIKPGTSLGGARPKAGVVDEHQTLFVAKFPSRKDDWDVALWEHLCHLLAKRAGICAAETSVMSVGEQYHTLLSKRFDRTASGQRIHFASALTLLGLTDGCNADTGNGYLDIVDFIIQNCCDVEANLRQLFRRVAFNICVGNSDDHFRNHGFLLTPRGWTLSPAYDLNPTDSPYQNLLINASTSRADLTVLAASSGDYLIPKNEAGIIIKEVTDAVKNWRNIAAILRISKRESGLFAPIFDRWGNCELSN